MLRDPDNFDFRPRADAGNLIDKGKLVRRDELPGKIIRLPEQEFVGSSPDIGAYEYGVSNYWIPGCTLPAASSPVPPDGSQTVKADADLMWLRGRSAITHNLYLAETKADAEWVDITFERPVSGQTGMRNNIFDPGRLVPGKTYYWRVDAVERDGSVVKGDVWSFRVIP